MPEKTNSYLKLRPTSFDVAREAGVSRSTVSLVFNNVSGNRVSAETRERILKAASDLGYHPDPAASALRKGYSNEISVIAPESPTSSVTAQHLESAEERALELGYSCGIYLFHNLSEDTKHSVFESIVARRPSGIICPSLLVTQEDVKFAKRMGVQALLLQGFKPVEYATTQLTHLEQAFYIAAKHLVEHGHKHIARLCPWVSNDIEGAANEIIMDGLRSAVGEVNGTITEIPMNLVFTDANTSVDLLLSSPNHPTAIVGNRDEYCFFLIKALTERGIRVPQDIAMVGINNSPFCSFSSPALTSVDFNVKTTTYNAIDAINALVHGKTPNPELLAGPLPQLVVRESS